MLGNRHVRNVDDLDRADPAPEPRERLAQRGQVTTAPSDDAVSCQHRFAGPHYCRYIQAPGVVATLAQATTADEQLLISCLAACVLWWHVQQRELAALTSALTSAQPLSPAQALLCCKRVERCLTLSHTMSAASRLVARALQSALPRIGFGVDGDLETHPLAAQVAQLATRLERWAWATWMQEPQPTQPSWTQMLASRLLDYAETERQVRSHLAHLVSRFCNPSQPQVALAALLPMELLAWADQTLRRHHPQAAHDPSATDPLVFIVAHQLFEVWFPATLRALEEARACLQAEPPQLVAATLLVQRAADLAQLWQQMIHLPQTMSAADYIAFRAQLEGGSGAESEQFRAVELLAGLREPRYRQTLTQMRLLTPRLEQR